MNQKEKTKFRSSAKWKRFRISMIKACNRTDIITGKKLYKGFNLHHKDLNSDHYTDLSNTSNFCCLNRQTHEFIHWLYRYYENDPDIINRLTALMLEMKNINK